MRGIDLLEKMDLIDSKFIEEAEEPIQKSQWKKVVLAAASIAIIAFGISRLFLPPVHVSETPPVTSEETEDEQMEIAEQSETEKVSEETELPMLTLSDGGGDGRGYAGIYVHDLKDYIAQNHIKAPDFETLPVYKNRFQMNFSTLSNVVLEEEMLAVLEQTVHRLDYPLEQGDVIINKTGEKGEDLIATSVVFEKDQYRIEVDQQLETKITVREILPDGVNTTDASLDEMEAIAAYVQTNDEKIIGFKNLQAEVAGGDVNYDGNPRYNIRFYEVSDDPKEEFINAQLYAGSFYSFEEELNFQIPYMGDLEIVGDYPLISKEEAKEVLLQNRYMSSVPYEISGEEAVQAVELVYQHGPLDAYFIPFYLFYVEIPAEVDNGTKHYGLYYVPAVQEKYISNMPLYDGGFN